MVFVAPGEARLVRADLPELYRMASSTSAGGQRRVMLLTIMLLGCGLGSGILAQFGGREGPPWHAWADVATALLFAGTAVGGELLNAGKAHTRWYEGRAAAESTKTLSWKYAMRAAQLADDATADRHFRDRLADIHSTMAQFSDAAPALREPVLLDTAISPAMRELRQAPVPVKRAAYHTGRLQDQVTWYTAKAGDAERRAWIWQSVSVVLGAAGFGGAMLRALGLFDLDALGLAATFITSIAAWTELRRYLSNAAAYRLAVRELRALESELVTLESAPASIANDPERWSAFCERAEYVISREHTMWRARAG